MYKIIIIDDEKYIRDELNYFLSKIEGYEVIYKTGDGDQVIPKIKELKPDVIFLDIELRYYNGMVLARQILELNNPPQIIISTAYDKYAVMGFELDVADYILKPFSLDRIKIALERAASDIGTTEICNKDRLLIKDKVIVKENDKFILIDLKDIYYFNSNGNNSQIFAKDKTYNIYSNLKTLENTLLERNFFRISKSQIVNIDKIEEITPWFNYTCKLKLKDLDDEISVSRNYYKKFKNIFVIK